MQVLQTIMLPAAIVLRWHCKNLWASGQQVGWFMTCSIVRLQSLLQVCYNGVLQWRPNNRRKLLVFMAVRCHLPGGKGHSR